ncbi:MAG: type IV secretion system DNA-binding domain-containing protein [Candidatus Kerfeldbacteria bacterium]|nr:type IV secretion system DNA-binding domain-containing protein [Candidatus Kerfeldbacteria bacterium]
MAIESQFEVNAFAETNFRNQSRKFGIKLDDRRRHTYIVGKTGMGKSVVLENMAYNDIKAGHGLVFIDPHGDTVEKLLDLIPAKRINDVVYFNPSDVDYPVAFNPLESVEPKYRHLVASGLVGVFKKIWADSWGPRLEYILRNAILSLLEYPGSTLLGITRILVDKYYRKKVLEKVSDPVVRSFWIDEYDNYNEKFRTEAISPIQNKIGQFLSSAIIRNIVGQPKSSIDLRGIMDEQKILLMDLSKGKVGEDNSALLGAMMVTKIQLAAMSRIDVPENERLDFFMYVDEFQNFITESFATILSEARKYRLDLTIAHQYIEQLGEVVKPAVFGNVGTMMLFQVGAEDAEFLEKEFGPTFTSEDLVSLPKYHIYIKLMIDGVTSSPFSATTLPPVGLRTNNREKVIKVSRERYATNRSVVEERILRWAGVEETFKETASQESKSLDPENDRYKDVYSAVNPRRTSDGEMPRLNLTQPRADLFEADCWVCGKKVQLPFRPDGIRPVYCKEDMKRIRQGIIAKPKPRLVVQEAPQPAAPEFLPTVAEIETSLKFDSVAAGEVTPAQDSSVEVEPVKPFDPLANADILPSIDKLSRPQSIKPGQVVRFE